MADKSAFIFSPAGYKLPPADTEGGVEYSLAKIAEINQRVLFPLIEDKSLKSVIDKLKKDKTYNNPFDSVDNLLDLIKRLSLVLFNESHFPSLKVSFGADRLFVPRTRTGRIAGLPQLNLFDRMKIFKGESKNWSQSKKDLEGTVLFLKHLILLKQDRAPKDVSDAFSNLDKSKKIIQDILKKLSEKDAEIMEKEIGHLNTTFSKYKRLLKETAVEQTSEALKLKFTRRITKGYFGESIKDLNQMVAETLNKFCQYYTLYLKTSDEKAINMAGQLFSWMNLMENKKYDEDLIINMLEEMSFGDKKGNLFEQKDLNPFVSKTGNLKEDIDIFKRGLKALYSLNRISEAIAQNFASVTQIAEGLGREKTFFDITAKITGYERGLMTKGIWRDLRQDLETFFFLMTDLSRKLTEIKQKGIQSNDKKSQLYKLYSELPDFNKYKKLPLAKSKDVIEDIDTAQDLFVILLK